ncbi:conserved Plasmodium protein, unknown function [Plasmodium reichenowi]|uniref:Uncharacterized protein n=1 Tax=Plasmodium reichenowi TaxID=5854 RepID=A0A2P9DF56_PLARE|nr:conserved Plasmodium protein, unknown function [Plasmodium reichenowi]
MFGKFISDTYNKVKSKADEVRLHVSVQAIKAKEVFGLVKPTTIEQLEVLLNYELQQIDSADMLISTYKKWIYNISQSDKSDCIRYYKSINKNNEKNFLSNVKQGFKNINEQIANFKDQKESGLTKKEVNDDMNEKGYQERNEDHNSDNNNDNDNNDNNNNDNNDNNNNNNNDNNNNNNDNNNNNNDDNNNNDNNNNDNNNDIYHFSDNSYNKNICNNDFNNSSNNISRCNSRDESNEKYTTYNKNIPMNINRNFSLNNIYDDHYGYNFKEYFLKSNILEKSISLILERRDIRLSLVGPIENEDVENPRIIILDMFKLCFIGNEKLHKDILFIILTTDKLFDNHKELFLELLSILKHDYLDIYLTNLRKIISSEVVCLKSKIQSYDTQSIPINNKLNSFSNISPKSTSSSLDFEEDQTNKNMLYIDKDKIKQTNIKNQIKHDENQKEDIHLKNETPTQTNEITSEHLNTQDEIINEKQENIEHFSKGNICEQIEHHNKIYNVEEDNIYEIGLIQNNNNHNNNHNIHNIHNIHNSYNFNLFDKDMYNLDIISNEKEVIESNKIHQIKILASYKLIDLHKSVEKILLYATENRIKRKEEIKIKLEELKKIMQVCLKDCDITLHDTEDSKVHIENVYVKELDIHTNNIQNTQDQITHIKCSIDELTRKKNELYNEYQQICKEIHLKNQELSNIISNLSTHKKQLTQAEYNYLNKLSDTSKAKHMHQERKLYISNLDNISDDILKEYEEYPCINTQELILKSNKIKKPIKIVIIKHINYLKDKLYLLNILLKFYIHKIKNIMEQNINQQTNINSQLDHNISDKYEQKENMNNIEKKNENNLLSIPDKQEIYQKTNPNEKHIKIMKYKKSYYKVIEQLNKTWINIQEFYDQNNEYIDEVNDTSTCTYEAIKEIYNNTKNIIRQNNDIISSIE